MGREGRKASLQGIDGMRLWRRKNERRGSIREQSDLETTCRVVDGLTRAPLTRSCSALVVDISEGGCCLVLPEAMVDDMPLQRLLDSPDDYRLELSFATPTAGRWVLSSQVRWIHHRRREGGLDYKVGAKFEEPVALPNNWRRLLLGAAAARA